MAKKSNKVNSLVSADLSDDESKYENAKKEEFNYKKATIWHENYPKPPETKRNLPHCTYPRYYEGVRNYEDQLKHCNEFVINNASLGNQYDRDDLSRYYSVYELPHQRYYDPNRFYNDYAGRNYPLKPYEYDPYRRYRYDPHNLSNFTLNIHSKTRKEEIEGDTNDLHPYIEHQSLKTFGADLDLDKPKPLKKNQGISTEKRLNQIVGGPSKENLRKSKLEKREKSVYVSLNTQNFDESSEEYKEIRDIVKRQYGTDNKDMANVIYNIIYGHNTHIIIQKQKVNNKTVIEEKIIDPEVKSFKKYSSRSKSDDRSRSRTRSEEKTRARSRPKSEEKSERIRSRLKSDEKFKPTTKSEEKSISRETHKSKSIERADSPKNRRSRSPKKKKTNQGMGVTQELLLKDYEVILGKNKNNKNLKKNFIDSFERISSRFNNELNQKRGISTEKAKIEEVPGKNEVLLDLDSEKLRQLLKSDGMKKEIVIDVEGIKEKEAEISKISTGVSAKNHHFKEVFEINNAEIAPRRDKSQNELYEEAILNLISKQFPQYSLESKDQINPGVSEAEKSNDLNKWENSALTQDGRSLSFFNVDEKAETKNEDPVSILSNDILNCLQESCKRTKNVPKQQSQLSKGRSKKKNKKTENETMIENILNLICYEKELSNWEIKNTVGSTKTKILKEAGTMETEKEITSNYVLVDTPDVLKSLEETLLNELLLRLCFMNDNQSVPNDEHGSFQNK